MVAFKNKLGALAAVGFLVAACTVTSTTTNPGDGGASSSSSGSSGASSSSGSSGASSSSGSSGTSSGSSGASSSGSSGGGDAATCKPLQVQFTPAACDTCVHANCQPLLDACFATVSTVGCDCQLLDTCVQGCLQTGGPNEKQCINDCGAAHVDAQQPEIAWTKCLVDKCGTEAGTGACP